MHEDITEDFDVGFEDGSRIVTIHNKADHLEVWSGLSKPGSKLNLWCDGLVHRIIARANDGHKRVRVECDLTPSRPTKKKQSEREGKTQEIVDYLKVKHSTTYTQLQLRIWAEMIVSGTHYSTDDPPNTSVFARAGGATLFKKEMEQPNAVTQALHDAATAIASAISPRVVSCQSTGVRRN